MKFKLFTLSLLVCSLPTLVYAMEEEYTSRVPSVKHNTRLTESCLTNHTVVVGCPFSDLEESFKSLEESLRSYAKSRLLDSEEARFLEEKYASQRKEILGNPNLSNQQKEDAVFKLQGSYLEALHKIDASGTEDVHKKFREKIQKAQSPQESLMLEKEYERALNEAHQQNISGAEEGLSTLFPEPACLSQAWLNFRAAKAGRDCLSVFQQAITLQKGPVLLLDAPNRKGLQAYSVEDVTVSPNEEPSRTCSIKVQNNFTKGSISFHYTVGLGSVNLTYTLEGSHQLLSREGNNTFFDRYNRRAPFWSTLVLNFQRSSSSGKTEQQDSEEF